MPGAKAIKAQVSTMIDQAVMNKMRVAAGLPEEPMTNNMLIVGNPGTGKTTLTAKMGELMFELGMIKSPEVVRVTRKDLVGPYANTAAQTTADLIEANRGKMIFVDEAYTLYTGPQDHEGRQVVDELMRLSEEYRGDTAIALAGYEEEMRRMFEVNPGLPSRFPNKLSIPDYTPPEKAAAMHYIVGENNRSYTNKGVKQLAGRYAAILPSEGEQGNVRAVRNFYDAMRRAQAWRIVNEPPDVLPEQRAKMLTTFTRDDVVTAAQIMGLPPAAKMRTPVPDNPEKQVAREGYRSRRSDVVAGR